MNRYDVVVVGGGISGLAAAYRLNQLNPTLRVALIEKEERLGGKIVTERFDGFVLEGGPDCFLSRKPRGIALCEELGITGELQGRRPENRKTYIKRHQTLHRLPEGLTGMIPTNLEALEHSTLISPAGRARLAREVELPPVPLNGDESVGHFISRRLGREVYQQLIEPLMGGIYAGNADQLSLAATFPHLRQLELEHGSLLRGLLARKPEQPSPPNPLSLGERGSKEWQKSYPPFVAFKNGMGTLVARLREQLTGTTIHLGCAVDNLDKSVTGYQMMLDNGQEILTQALILTTPAYITAHLLRPIDTSLAQAHANIPYASSAIVTLIYPKSQLSQPLNGYGYVIPRAEDEVLLACTWTSSKWAARVPADQVMIRVYMGRFGQEEVVRKPDEDLVALARRELADTLEIHATPLLHRVYRFPKGMPQYVMGHPERLAQIDERLSAHAGLFLAGAAYRGVGIPDCIHSGEKAAYATVSYLESRH